MPEEPKSPPFLSRLGRAPLWWQAAIYLDAGFSLWLLSAPEKTRTLKLASLWLLAAFEFVSSWAFREASRRDALPGEVRSGLRFIAAGMLMIALGSTYVAADATAHFQYSSLFSIADALYLVSYPLILIGLVRLPRGGGRSSGTWHIVVDGAAFVVGVGVPLWLGAVGPAWTASRGIDAFLMVLWPAVALLGLFCLNAALLTRATLPSRGAVWFLFCGIAVSWLADLLFSLDAAALIVKQSPIRWTNMVNALSLGLCLVAAWRYKSDPIAPAAEARPVILSPVPLVTMVIVAALLILVSLSGTDNPRMLGSILPGLIILFAFLLVREVFALVDTARWMKLELERESQAQIEAMVAHASDVLMVVGADQTLRFASPSVATVLGHAPAVLVGRPFLDLVHPEDLLKGAEFIEGLITLPTSFSRIIWRLRRSNGSYCFLETAGSNALEVPAVSGLVFNSRDVNDRMSTEDDLRRSHKLEAITRLTGGIAHNFNNILTTTLLTSDLLRDSKLLPPELAQDIAELDRGSRRTAELIKQLQSFGQIQLLRPEKLSLSRECARLEPVIAGLLGDAHKVVVEGSVHLHWVLADATLLEQVILNLCSNAKDAMPEGGTLTIRLTHAELKADGAVHRHEGSFECLTIKDTGRGMDETVQKHLFEPFFTTKDVGKGLGLGLAAVHGIVTQHKGWIRVDSAPGHGSTFRIFLPAFKE